MPQIDFKNRSLICKIVYYGPGLSGKTTNLSHLHENLPSQVRGRILSLETEQERTLFFDFFPASLGKIRQYDVRLHFFTVPGQSFYNVTRRSLLQNVDGLVFVADSSERRMDACLDSLADLDENLAFHDRVRADLPWVIQYNKRDLSDAVPIDELRAQLNPEGAPEMEAVAMRGEGVFETQRLIVKNALSHIHTLLDG